MARRKTLRPRDLEIIARKPTFSLLDSLQNTRYWYSDDPIGTHFVDALQATFPEGERFFIEAATDCIARHGHAHALDPELASDFKLFSRQEALHGHIHRLWTAELMHRGYEKMAKYETQMISFRKWFKRHVPAIARLAITAAAEHYTASLAYTFVFFRPELITKSLPPFQGILLYHTMEEVEHKSVCFDLLTTFSRSYLVRMLGFIYLTFYLAILVIKRFRYLLKKDGLLGGSHARVARKFFLSKNGLLRKIGPRIMLYLSPSFHPWKTDDRGDIEEKFGAIRKSAGIEAFQYREMPEL